jgi:membrane protein required for colicin V production
MSNLSAFDWLLLVILAVSTITAFRRGLIRELFALGGLVAGILLASWYYPVVAGWLRHLFAMGAIDNVVAFLVVAIGVMLLAAALGKLLRRTAKAVGLGFVDRLGGAGFGLLRGLLLGVAIMMAVAAFLPHSDWVRRSRMAPGFLQGAHAVSFVVPGEFQSLIRYGVEQFKRGAPDWIKPHH